MRGGAQGLRQRSARLFCCELTETRRELSAKLKRLQLGQACSGQNCVSCTSSCPVAFALLGCLTHMPLSPLWHVLSRWPANAGHHRGSVPCLPCCESRNGVTICTLLHLG